MRTITKITIACAMAAAVGLSFAQSYPSKPIRLIVPYPAGGGTDVIARLVADRMSVRLGQPIIVDNRVGAGGIVGTNAGARATPDGYTILMGTSGTIVMGPNLQKVPYDPVADLAPVGQITKGGLIIVSGEKSGIHSIADMRKIAAAAPDGLTYASGGVGTGGHIIGESLRFLTNMRLVHVPYKGTAGPTNDLLGGHIPLMIGDTQVTITHIKAGKILPVAVAGTERNACVPDVPTLKEQGVPFELQYWWGLFAPAKTPKPIVDRLNHELNAILKSPDVLAQLDKLCQGAANGTPEQYGKLVSTELENWGKLIRAANIKAE